jgi:hypothetical protein
MPRVMVWARSAVRKRADSVHAIERGGPDGVSARGDGAGGLHHEGPGADGGQDVKAGDGGVDGGAGQDKAGVGGDEGEGDAELGQEA